MTAEACLEGLSSADLNALLDLDSNCFADDLDLDLGGVPMPVPSAPGDMLADLTSSSSQAASIPLPGSPGVAPGVHPMSSQLQQPLQPVQLQQQPVLAGHAFAPAMLLTLEAGAYLGSPQGMLLPPAGSGVLWGGGGPPLQPPAAAAAAGGPSAQPALAPQQQPQQEEQGQQAKRRGRRPKDASLLTEKQLRVREANRRFEEKQVRTACACAKGRVRGD